MICRVIFAILILSVFAAACSSDIANRYYLTERYPPKTETQVELLFSKPDRKFIVMADFQSKGETPEDYRKKAAEIGADAVIVSYIGGYYSTDEQWADRDRYKNAYYSHIVGTAIKYSGDDQK